MKLSEQDAKLFFQLVWALQFYVNQKLKIHDIKSIDDYAGSATDQKVKVREALCENIELIDSFVQENPQNFSTENLAIISQWKKFIRGSFFIERLLKKCAVFMQEDNVYDVLGLSQSFDQVTYNADLPLYVETVLLPFKGKIVYDGLLGFQNIFFGGGIKRKLQCLMQMTRKASIKLCRKSGVHSTNRALYFIVKNIDKSRTSQSTGLPFRWHYMTTGARSLICLK